jgi:hypothetical protein
MRAAPAVSVQCSGGNGWRLMQALVPALAVGAILAWALGWAQRPVAPALCAIPVVAALAWWRARPLIKHLSWDGQSWRLEGAEGEVQVMIDLGGWMLLRFDSGAPILRRQWVAVSTGDAGDAQRALRAAVYCRRPEPSPGSRSAPPGPPADRPD